MRPPRWDEWREPGPVVEAEESGLRRVSSIPSDERRHERRSQYEPVPRRRASDRDGTTLMPLFPVAGFFYPGCPCPHRGPIPEGSSLVCMVCHRSGMDASPLMRETAADKLRVKGWEPEGGKDQWGHATEATAYEGEREKTATPTRKQRRAAFRDTKNT